MPRTSITLTVRRSHDGWVRSGLLLASALATLCSLVLAVFAGWLAGLACFATAVLALALVVLLLSRFSDRGV